jgi:hypothetical protein
MMAWVHASVGAALGSRIKNRAAAFSAGVVSHLICDLFPHRDYELPVESALMTITLTVIAVRHGASSPEMAGAIGAIAPDIENGLQHLGIVEETFFPTHTRRLWFIGHGRKIKSPISQLILACACLALAEIGRGKD